jgi:hypothetical protein
MNKHSTRIKIEKELDWFYNVYPVRVGISAIDPGAIVVSNLSFTGYTDAQISAVERALPIREALKKCKAKDQKILYLVFTLHCWRTEVDHHGVSGHHDYGLVYGKLAGVVRSYRIRGSKDEKRAKAEALFERALNRFMWCYQGYQN